MEFILICVYVAVLVVQIALLATKRRTAAFILALVSTIAAVVLTAVFNALPGSGMMPGLTWFAEVIYSMIAAAGYAIVAVVSLILLLIRKKK